jgi:hypothetical protein
MDENRLFVRSGHNYPLLSLLSFEKIRKRVQIFWMDASLILTKRECMQTHIQSIQNYNFIEIELLHFSLQITRMRSRRCFKR